MINLMNHKKKVSVKSTYFIQSLLKNCMMIIIPILIIAPFTIIRSLRENTKEVKNNTYQTLVQVENMVDTLYSHLDNSIIFFSSNPQVTTQLKKAFYEKSLSLASIKNTENLSLYFQNLAYTDPYISNIYIYFDNDYNRIFIPPHGALQQLTEEQNSLLLTAYENTSGKDFWVEVKDTGNGQSLLMFQTLYQRGSSFVNGFISLEFDMQKLEEYFYSLLQYDERIIYLLDSDGNTVYTNDTRQITEKELEILSPSTAASDNYQLFKTKIHGEPVMAAYLESERENGFTYITFSPMGHIYKDTSNLSTSYIVLTLFSIFLSFFIALYKTNKEYSYLNHILDIFSNPEKAKNSFKNSSQTTSNPFEAIMLNIIQMFIAQDYLKMQDAKKEYELRDLKNQALQYQINPHFLHNTLNSIYWTAVKMTSSENDCSKMVSNLSSVMRYVFSDPEENIEIHKEVSYLKTYLDIISIRYEGQFTYDLKVSPSCEKYPIKKMLLQPLVENAVQHGMKDGYCSVYIGIKKLSKSVLAYVLDTGSGMSPEKLKEVREHLNSNESIDSNSVGLNNTNLRLKLSYGERSALRIKSVENKYTLIYFYIPWEDN